MTYQNTSQAVPQLELLGLQYQGRANDFIWQWPDQAFMVGFDTILGNLEDADPGMLQQACYCKVQRAGAHHQPVWLLSNSSHEIVCSVNQHVLAAGSQLRLAHGDEIELGFARFVVSLEPMPAMPHTQDTHAKPDHAHPDAHKESAEPFDLTALDALADISALTDAAAQGLKRTDFGDIISMAPREQIQTQEPAPDQAKLLTDAGADTALAEALNAGKPPSYSEKVSGLLQQFSAGAEIPKQVETLTNDPLDALHSQYLAKLRNPVHSDEQDQWSDIVRGDSHQQADPMLQWMQAAGNHPSLDDLLGQAHSIASVIQGLDALGTADVLVPEPFDSVMHLFAPDHLRAQTQDTLETLVHRSLPGLTRREHHSLSLDSVMPFTGREDTPSKTE
jgi:hypothetical protein